MLGRYTTPPIQLMRESIASRIETVNADSRHFKRQCGHLDDPLKTMLAAIQTMMYDFGTLSTENRTTTK
jgi:hypothetical protein